MCLGTPSRRHNATNFLLASHSIFHQATATQSFHTNTTATSLIESLQSHNRQSIIQNVWPDPTTHRVSADRACGERSCHTSSKRQHADGSRQRCTRRGCSNFLRGGDDHVCRPCRDYLRYGRSHVRTPMAPRTQQTILAPTAALPAMTANPLMTVIANNIQQQHEQIRFMLEDGSRQYEHQAQQYVRQAEEYLQQVQQYGQRIVQQYGQQYGHLYGQPYGQGYGLWHPLRAAIRSAVRSASRRATRRL